MQQVTSFLSEPSGRPFELLLAHMPTNLKVIGSKPVRTTHTDIAVWSFDIYTQY